ncbi:MAG: arylsulfatase [Opitutus sp.]|nr:arylsulfatase [Opitutus sp.]
MKTSPLLLLTALLSLWPFSTNVRAQTASSGRTYRDATPSWPERSRPPAGAPNVIFVVLDDVGFAQLGCYGAPIATPNIDRLAAQGLRYTNFHTCSVCSPTRAALLTGRNPHTVGVGTIAEFANGLPNSRGGIRRDAGTLAEMLRARGYSTTALGKWHLTPMEEMHVTADDTYWPTGRGFEYFYGYMGGDTNQWTPELYQDRKRIVPPEKFPDGRPYHLDADLTDHAIEFVAQQRASAPERPFFLYLAYCAGHAPHHVPREFIDRYRGKFDAGWDAARDTTLERQKQLGVVREDVALPPPNPGIRQWSALTADERRVYARYYEVFAGYMEHTDSHLGRLLDYLDRAGVSDNTLVVLLSDNGASPEGGPDGIWNEVQTFSAERPSTLALGLKHFDGLGGPLTYPTYPTGWTQAGGTPWRMTKGTVFEGGTHVPLIMRWPARIKTAGALRPQFSFVNDLAPTVLEASGINAPASLGTVAQIPLDGTSLAYTWQADGGRVPTQKRTQYFEIYGHRALWADGWKIVAPHTSGTPWEKDRWQLYHLDTDPAETRDLAAAQPEKLAALTAAWEPEAQHAGVYPLDDRTRMRDVMRSPANLARTSATYYPPVSGLPKATALEYRQRSFSITAEVTRANAAGDGVLLAQGGRFAGFALYVLGNRLVFHYNWGGLERTTVTSDEALPAGAHALRVDFTRAPDETADVTLSLDGRAVGRGHVPHAITGNISHEPLDLGRDNYTPVSEDYAPPFAFRGEIRKVTVATEPVR